MSRLPLLCLAVAALAGCRYAPLDYEESIPQLGDAVAERDIVVFGEARFPYYEDNDDFICELVLDIEGWVEDDVDPSDVGCVGCTENFTLAFSRTSDSGCNHTIPGSATIAITPIPFFDRDSNPEFLWNILTSDQPPDPADGPAIAFLNTNWDPRGEADWRPRLALYDAAETSDTGSFVREYYAAGFYYWGTSFGSTSWFMDLQLTQ